MRNLVLFHFLLVGLFLPISAIADSGWIPFTLEDGHMYVSVKVAGVETKALLDTSADASVINSAFIKKHQLELEEGKPVNVPGVFGEPETRTAYNKVNIELQGSQFNMSRIPESTFAHHTTGMIFGRPFFNTGVFQIDYPNQRLRIISRSSIDLKSSRNVNLRVLKDNNQPAIMVGLGSEKKVWLLLETGSNDSIIVSRNFASRSGILEQYNETQVAMSVGINNAGVSESVYVDNFEFGPFTLDHVKVSFPAVGQKTNQQRQSEKRAAFSRGTKIEGSLGYAILKHFLVTIDYKKGYMHLDVSK